MKHKKRKMPFGFEDWMDGYCDFFDDLPDGAWQAACESAVEVYNQTYGTHIDPYDGWMYWVTKRSTLAPKAANGKAK